MTLKTWKASWADSPYPNNDAARAALNFVRDHTKGLVVSDGGYWFFKTTIADLEIRTMALPTELFEATEEEYEAACASMRTLLQDMEDEYHAERQRTRE